MGVGGRPWCRWGRFRGGAGEAPALGGGRGGFPRWSYRRVRGGEVRIRGGWLWVVRVEVWRCGADGQWVQVLDVLLEVGP